MKAAIIDFNRTLFDPDKKEFIESAFNLLLCLKKRNWRLGLISTNSFGNQKEIEQIASFFTSLQIVSEKTVLDFDKMRKTLGVSAKNIVVIGDEVQRELRVGKTLGMRTIWIRERKSSQELPENTEIADFVCSNLNQAINYINQQQIGGL